MLPYGVQRAGLDWSEMGSKSQVCKIRSKRRQSTRRIFKKRIRAEVSASLRNSLQFEDLSCRY
jgi:antitoxin component HigA of HigAB toxin-antitoxin module